MGSELEQVRVCPGRNSQMQTQGSLCGLSWEVTRNWVPVKSKIRLFKMSLFFASIYIIGR